MIRPRAICALLALALLTSIARPLPADPRPPVAMDAAAIRLALEKLNVVGSALYVGAHPDDENTAVLAWLSKGRKVRAAYLSLTRGDGGQNLIGTDFGERLGVIRTQELLAARRVDGAEQFFTRAVDFGFSKNADETLRIWGRDSILADVVWVIRRFQPDVIITRFLPDSSAGHGHHTASAILAEAAFRAAADPARFPGQLRWVKPWQAKRLVWNAYRFGGAGPDTTPGRIQVDLGAYEPLLGRSFTEIAGEARSMHKTQGFGAAERRGSFTNAFAPRAGAPATRELFDGVNLTWSRIPGGARLQPILAQALREFRAERPEGILPLLLKAHAVLATLPDEPIVVKKRAELLDVIRACAGLWLEAVATVPDASPGDTVRIVTTAINRSAASLHLAGIQVGRPGDTASQLSSAAGSPIAFNRARSDTLRVPIPADYGRSAAPRSGEYDMWTAHPYWLRQPAGPGQYAIARQLDVGSAENPAQLVARFEVVASGERLVFEVPVVHRWTDPVQGERYRSFEIVPPAALHLDRPTYFFGGGPREVRVTVRRTSPQARPADALELVVPKGWRAEPQAVPIRLRAADAETTVRFQVTPGSAGTAEGLFALLSTKETVPNDPERGGRIELLASFQDADLVQIDYPHIPIQLLLPIARSRVVRADVRTEGRSIAYVMGAGDDVPDALRQMGFAVTMLSDDDVESGDLSRFDCVVVGVRAYNTRPRLLARQRRLLDWVAAGGRLVVQYQTPDAALKDRLGPWPFTVSRDRVTVEEAPVRMLKPDHPLLTTPNRITDDDFEGWVQERGLWFANPWDRRYETVLSCNDPNEPPRDGGLLYARHGRGTFIYTGYAFFRQLPAGVPGAWRLFANLVSATGADGRPTAGQ